MSSLSPPQTGDGNAKYIVVVVLLLGGIAGLLIWRAVEKPVEPVVIHAPDAAAPVPVNPRLDDDDVPPPVPIVDAGRTPIRTTGGGMERANCGATRCSGASTPDLE